MGLGMALGYRINAKAGDRAEVLLYSDIGESFLGGVSDKQFATDLRSMGAVKTIDVRINSFGGDVYQGLSMYRNLAEHPARVVVHIDGVAASIASVIAMAGNEINIAEPAEMMIHNAHGAGHGFSEDFRSIADRLDAVSNSIADIYASRTGRPSSHFKELMKLGEWMSSSRALSEGLVTNVVSNVARIAAHYDPSIHSHITIPPRLDVITAPMRDEAAEVIKRMQARQNAARLRGAVKRD